MTNIFVNYPNSLWGETIVDCTYTGTCTMTRFIFVIWYINASLTFKNLFIVVTYEQLLLLPRQQENDQMSFPNDLSVLTLCAFQQCCILIGCLSQGSFLIGCLGQGCSLIGCLSHLAFHGSVNSITLLHVCLMHLSYMFIMFMLEMMNNSVLFVIVFIL